MDSQNNQNQSAPQQNPQNNSAPQMSTGNNNTVFGVLSYLGPLVIVAYLMGKDSEFVKFHARQGFVVFAIEVIMWILGSMMMYSMYMIMNLLNLVAIVLSIIGIVNVIQGNKKELPVVGQFSKYFNF